jgi:pilus assembly protein CpaF
MKGVRVRVTTAKGTPVSADWHLQMPIGIGRSSRCAVRLHGWRIASQHAAIEREDDGLHLKVLDGDVRVNGCVSRGYGPLSPDDIIEIHDYRLDVAAATAIEVDTPPASPGPPAPVDTPSQVPAEGAGDPETAAIQHEWQSRLRRRLHEQMDLRRIDVSAMSDQRLRALTTELVGEILQGEPALPKTINATALTDQVVAEAVGLGPLEPLLSEDGISEIMVNNADEIFFERDGKLLRSPIRFTDDAAVQSIIQRIVAPLGRRIDEASPMVDARLGDGSRVNAVIPPLALKGACITIRKFMQERLTCDRLQAFGSLSPQMAAFLELAVRHRRNVLISGGTGSGKTTLLNVLSNFIPTVERIVTIEDAAELRLYQPNLIALEARPPNQEGRGAISIRDLVRNALRMRPDRIVVGECRGGEALDMLQAMNTGHDGSLTTAHANSPRDCLARLEVMVMMAGMDLPISAIREQLASAVNLIVQQTRFACGARKVTCIAEVVGVENGRIQLSEVFRFRQTGYSANGQVQGRFEATGLIPEFYEQLRNRGVATDLSLFASPESPP